MTFADFLRLTFSYLVKAILMKRHLQLLAGVGVLILLASAPSFAQKDKKDPLPTTTPNYYPLQVDNAWTFKVTVGANSVDAISRITKIEDIKGEKLARLEATINGNVAATEHLRQTSEGIFRHRNNGQDISPPICLLKYPVKANAKWDGDMVVGTEKGKYSCETKEEEVEVTAGKFKTIRVKIKLESQGKTIYTTYWFAPDVGFVKQTVEAGELNVVMDLQKFELAKEKKK